jgi:hypothetical protein
MNGITYGNNRFVAVGRDGTMAYSSDGVTWTAAVSSTVWNYTYSNGNTWAMDISNVAYGGNRFVAVGFNGKMAYSSDGRSWTAVSNSRFGDDTILGITYGNNRFVAVGSSGTMAYSSDGVTWTAVSTGTIWDYRPLYGDLVKSDICAVTYGNNRFVAVGSGGKMAYSSDGVRWTAVSTGTIWDDRLPNGDIYKSEIRAVTYGNNRFVAVGELGKIAYSTDGITWTPIASNVFGESEIYGITYGNGRFIALISSGRIAYCDW